MTTKTPLFSDRRLLLILVAFFFSLTTVSALDEQQVPFIAEQWRPYDIQIPCELNGWYCSSTTQCNITLSQPNSTYLVRNQRMTVNGAVVNYTLTGTQTRTLGRYLLDAKCLDPTTGFNASTQGILIVTPTGGYENTSSNIFLFIMGIIFSLFLIILGFYREDAWTGFFGGFLLTILGVYVLINGIGLYHNDLTNGIAIVAMFFSLYICIRAGIEVIDENFK